MTKNCVTTPADAIKAGADYLVVGRPIMLAENPILVAQNIIDEIDQAMESSIISGQKNKMSGLIPTRKKVKVVDSADKQTDLGNSA